MVETQFFYRLDTFQIDAVYRGCKSGSSKFTDGDVYAEVNVVDPSYVVSRDHIVILDPQGVVIDTSPNVNPVQPTPTKPEVPTSIELKSSDGLTWTIKVDDTGKIGCKKNGM